MSAGLYAIDHFPFQDYRGIPCALLTNDAARDSRGVRTVDHLLQGGVDLTLLLSPEHGLAGSLQAGEEVPDGRDAATGLPVVSLYGKEKILPGDAWRRFQVLLVDLPDVGVRYYTYAHTVFQVLKAGAAHGISACILDRPDPLGKILEGPVLESSLRSDVGACAVPVRHGMSLGEYVVYAHAKEGAFPGMDFRILEYRLPGEAAGCDCDEPVLFPQFGVPWIPPSPNLPSFEALCCYPGTCLFEGTNLSEGRGTESPFQLVGAPFVDGTRVLQAMEHHTFPGLRLEPAVFAPTCSKHAGIPCGGVRFVVTDPAQCRSFAPALELLDAVRRKYPDAFRFNATHFDHLLGSSCYRRGEESCRQLLARSEHACRIFQERWTN